MLRVMLNCPVLPLSHSFSFLFYYYLSLSFSSDGAEDCDLEYHCVDGIYTATDPSKSTGHKVGSSLSQRE